MFNMRQLTKIQQHTKQNNDVWVRSRKYALRCEIAIQAYNEELSN